MNSISDDPLSSCPRDMSIRHTRGAGGQMESMPSVTTESNVVCWRTDGIYATCDYVINVVCDYDILPDLRRSKSNKNEKHYTFSHFLLLAIALLGEHGMDEC